MMNNDVAIKVENLTKTYKLYDSPLDRLKEALSPTGRKYHKDFYALNDLSFEIRKGETVGVIGENGSGKSTLLKIITGVSTPSSGSVEVDGKISALLELGAGFNPELTGIENVYFSGTMMGYSRAEMEKKLEDILAFADIGEYVHQPVKTYSSGMFVRLAFAVATIVDPDHLIVDEALSVGDLAFRNKCMTRIKEIRDRGANILFVSHDLSTLQMICDRVIWLNDGEIMAIGDPISVVQDYHVFMAGKNAVDIKENLPFLPQQETGSARFVDFSFKGFQETEQALFTTGQDIQLKFTLLAEQFLNEIVFAVSVYRSDGDLLIGQSSHESNVIWPQTPKGDLNVGCFVLKENCLAPGDYKLAIGAYSRDFSNCYAMTEASLGFSVRSKSPTWGKFVHPCNWINESDTNERQTC